MKDGERKPVRRMKQSEKVKKITVKRRRHEDGGKRSRREKRKDKE